MLFLFVCLFGPAWASPKEEEAHVFSTWEGFEADKCASIWLIKRFVDPEAVFRFFPKEEAPMAGIAFDTPDAQLRRYHNRSTYESILVHYRITDQKLLYIGRIMHDIEINVWEKKKMPETTEVRKTLDSIIGNGKDREDVIQKSMEFLDALYARIPAEPRSP